MIKCFLSHSSRDKDFYVRVVAKHLKKEARVFDEETFEKGMSPSEEIINGLDESSLFVIFISNASLESEWVKNELSLAKVLLDASKLQRVYPIIIEAGIDHTDVRIPGWMRESLNIQPILKPTIAARKINARLTEISWNLHPRLKEREEIFVGRNDLTKEIEERLDDFSKEAPIALVSSGLPSIGRKSLIAHALRKGNLVRDSYDFPVISLSALDGIEDFIVKIHDLGFVTVGDFSEKLNGVLAEKIELAKEISLQIAAEKERILIEDRGVLIQDNGELVDWFEDVCSAVGQTGHLTFGVASKFRLNRSVNWKNPLIFSVAVEEMEVTERNGLLKRYAEFQTLNLSKVDYSFFADLLTGYPEQVLFSVDLINSEGLLEARKQSHTIRQYGSDKAKVVLDSFAGDKEALEFIHFMSRFEFISYEVLFDMLGEDNVLPLLQKVLAGSVCEKVGRSGMYIRVNEVIRDYVSRNHYSLPRRYEDAIAKHVQSFLTKYEDDNYDISDYIFSAQELLRNGKSIPDGLIIPSVFIKAIKKLYEEEKNFGEAIALADRVLKKEKFFHENTVAHIRYIKCQCYARQHNSKFFGEVQKLAKPARAFLSGFYYRLAGNFSKAEEFLAPLVTAERRDPKVLGELVLVYMQSYEYDKAFALAKESYNKRSSNQINANNYFTCLLTRGKSAETLSELKKIIAKLSLDQSERAQEMMESMRARYAGLCEDDEYESMQIIEAAIHRFENVKYPLLTKADLAAHFQDKEKLKEAVTGLEKLINRKSSAHRTLVRYKAMLLAMEGNLDQAKQLVNTELKGMIKTGLDRLNEKLSFLAGH